MVTTVVTTQTWLGRIGESIKSFVIGLALFIGAFPLLWINEGRAVRTEKGLHEGAGLVVEAPADRVDPATDGKLVHLTANAAAGAPLVDDSFGITADAIKLRRSVEMYQWIENEKSVTQKKAGGGSVTRTTYTYSKKWTDKLVNSANFREAGHKNPPTKPFESRDVQAAHVTLGAHALSPSLVAKMDDYEPLKVSDADVSKLPTEIRSYFKASDGAFYLGDGPQDPEVGDVRVLFSIVKPGQVSVVAKQAAATFEPYRASSGFDIELLQRGAVPAQAMFASAIAQNTAMTWILRVAGFLAMFFGMRLIFRPLSVAGDVVPLVGTLLAFGAGVFAFVASGALSVVTIALAWIFYRPLLGIVLLAAPIGVLVWFAMRGRKKVAGLTTAQPVPAALCLLVAVLATMHVQTSNRRVDGLAQHTVRISTVNDGVVR